MVPGDPNAPTARGTETDHALTRIKVDYYGDSETGSSCWATSFSADTRPGLSDLQTALEKRTHRPRPPPRSALQKCIRTNGLPSLKLAGVSVDARQQETESPPVADFPSGRFPLRGSLSALQPEAPTRGFEPNCGACFGQRLLSSVIPQKPACRFATTTASRERSPTCNLFPCVDDKGFLLVQDAASAALHTFQPTPPRLANPAIGSNFSPPNSASHPLHPPASTARSARLHYPRQSQRGNLQPSLARPKRTAQGSQPRRPTRADVLAWDSDWGLGGRQGKAGGSHSPVGRQTRSPRPTFHPADRQPALFTMRACEMSAGFRR
jgi:hypothetical protein